MKKHRFALTATFAVAVFLSALAIAGEEFPPRVNPGRLAAIRRMKNPQVPDSESIADGRKIYFGKGLCFNCHGDKGKGDGPAAASFNPPPRDFTNAKWQKLRSDGEIFTVITEGTQFGMIAFDDNLTVKERWNLVNYLRTLNSAK